ncbi:hypothetical protein M231_06956 [Tremella mesenterica]|uniref:Uncharacterized protein n=1 Tax=Tremella mesenterica TaxID=5217 RepID=A0A4V1M363_TREME|nr:hypothetical protein M231_06956 [Tremella mesenterica]
MEVYFPPSASYLPRAPPPRPVVPAVPIVPIPDLPEVLHAPEGTYTLNNNLFCPAGITPSQMQDKSGQGSFIVSLIAPPPMAPQNSGPPIGQSAISFGSTIVNGQNHPAYPVRMSWISVYFPPKAGDRGLGGLFGGGKDNKEQEKEIVPIGYEASEGSGSTDPSSDIPNPRPMDIPVSAIPPKHRAQWLKSASLSALPRPKNNLRSSSSTFVTRLQTLETMPKITAERGKGGGETVRWGFWNLGRTFGWGEEGGKIREALARVTFSQIPTCHAVSHLTASPDRLDIIVGFASGDIVWLDFILGRYTRINKAGLLNSSAVISVQFDPRQAQHFTAVFSDGIIMQFNLFAEDPMSMATSSSTPWTNFFASRAAQDQSPGDGEGFRDQMLIWKNEDFSVQPEKGKERSMWAGKNPTAVWKVGKKQITAYAYSPDGRWLALTSDDGMMRLVDATEETLTDTFAGYFSALTCVAWSPDSRFVAVGGQDDLITIFSPRETRIVARCQGHSAFVTSITFDSSSKEGRGYRFASVGEDGKLCLWDFSAASLHRPRHHHTNTSHHKIPPGSVLSLAAQTQSQSQLPIEQGTSGRYHAVVPKNEVAMLQPVMARMIEGNIITGVYLSPSAIITVSRAAGIKFWQRPAKPHTSNKQLQVLSPNPNGSLGRENREAREVSKMLREKEGVLA